MTKVVIASLFAHKRRLFGMFVSVFLGVAFLSGTLVMGDTLDKNFKSLFTDVNAGTDVAVRRASDITTDYESQRGVIDASIADDVARVDGVEAVSPSVEGYGQIRGKDGDALGGNGPPTLAGSWIEDPELNPFHIAEGRAPRTPDEVVINRGAAKSGDLHLGDTTLVSTPAPHQVTIVGIATFGNEDGLGTVTNAFFTLDAAERYITGPGQVTSIVVRAEPGVSQQELLARIEPGLPRGVEAITGTQRTTQDLNQLGDDFLNAFKTFLVIFAGIAMLVAAFSIHNTFSILVAQRTRESALLRTIGASATADPHVGVGRSADVGTDRFRYRSVRRHRARATAEGIVRELRRGAAIGRPRVRAVHRGDFVDRGRDDHAARGRGARMESVTGRAARRVAGDRRRSHACVPAEDGRGLGAARRRHRARPLRRVRRSLDRIGRARRARHDRRAFRCSVPSWRGRRAG